MHVLSGYTRLSIHQSRDIFLDGYPPVETLDTILIIRAQVCLNKVLPYLSLTFLHYEEAI